MALIARRDKPVSVELRHLRYFVAVANRLSFTQAARSIHVAQAAVSKTVKYLEEELGVELLVRTRRSVKLTAAGATFLGYAERIVTDVGAASAASAKVARGESGSLTIGFLGASAAPFLPALLREFLKLRPDVHVALADSTPRDLTHGLAAGRIDVGITRPEIPGAHRIPIEEFELQEDELCAVMNRSHPLAAGRGALALKLFAREPFVLIARSSSPWYYDTVIGMCRRAGFSPRVVMSANHLITTLMLVEAGIGIGVAPACSAHHVASATLVYRTLAPKSPPIPTLLIWPRGIESPVARAFIDFVRRKAPEIPRLMRASRGAILG